MASNDGAFAEGDLFGSYTIVRMLGEGAFGEVYEANNKLGYRVAIKTLKREHARRADLRARFTREALSAVKIRHPNALQVIDTGEKGDVPYLVMEFLEGEDLDSLLHRVHRLSPTAATDILLPVMAALAAAHDEGVIHRDLKPANIFLSKTRDGEIVPKVVDFGISRLVDANAGDVKTQTSALLGSPAYMSPEQTRGAGEVRAASDQFSLGTVFYECVTGQRPFDGNSLLGLMLKVSEADFPPPRTIVPEIPEDFEAVLLRAMHVDPAQRYPSIREFGHDLIPFASQRVSANFRRVFDPMGSSTLPTTPEPRVRRPSREHDAIGKVSTLGGAAASLDASRRSFAQPPTPRSNRTLAIVGAAAVVLVGITAGVLRAQGTSASRTQDFRVELHAQPAVAAIMIDGVRTATGSYMAKLPRDGRPHRLQVTADGYVPFDTTFVDTSPDPNVTLERRQPAADPTDTAHTVRTTPTAPAPAGVAAVGTPAGVAPVGTSAAPVAAAPAVAAAEAPTAPPAPSRGGRHGGHHHGGAVGAHAPAPEAPAASAHPPSGGSNSVTGVY